MAALLLGVCALALAWATFRIERFGSRQREIEGARSLLLAVNQALVSGWEGPKFHPGWGEITFETVYTPEVLKERSDEAIRHARMGGFDQVFVVPTEPLEKIATSTAAPHLLSIETVAAANFGLWRVHVFNQLVFQQTVFNAVTHYELHDADTTEARKEAIARSAKRISSILHSHGVDGAGTPDGWYVRLKDAISADLDRLEEMGRKTPRRWIQGRPFASIDVLVASGVLTVAGFTIALGP